MRRSLAALLCLAVLQPAGAAGFGGVVGASTDNVFRGISESAGDPAAQAGVHYGWNSGAFAGLRGASTRRRSAAGLQDTLELDAFLGYGFTPADAWSLRTLWVHYAYPWSNPVRRGYDELAIDATWRGCVTLSAAASPNRPGAGGGRYPAYDYELALRWPVGGAVSLDAGVGYYDLSQVYDTAYAYWSGGVTYAPGPLSLDLTWIGTDAEARAAYGDTAGSRVVASALWTF